MKTMKKSFLVLCCLVMTAGAAWAVDYSKMSNDELSAKRGTMSSAGQEEWNAFHTEWWKRLSEMTPEERQKYMGPGKGRGMGRGKGMGMGRGGCCPCWNGPAGVGQTPKAGTAGPSTGQ
jgi:hypothetical protein